MSRVQAPFLADPTNLNPTIAPIDTYFQAAQRGVSGAPVGPNPARQIAEALGRFDQSLQQFYFQPAHEEMIQQQRVDAQVLKDRYENFNAWSEAVGKGEVDHGDNPWLQVFIKDLYAKDAVNTLSIRAAELSDRQDILGADDPAAAYSAEFAKMQQEILEQAGGLDDPYLRRSFLEASEPVRQRTSNQFAQGLRRFNINEAATQYQKDLGNALENVFDRLAAGETIAIDALSGEITESLRAIKGSNLLPTDLMNSMVVDALAGKAREWSDENPTAAGQLLKVLENIETSPGSKLGAIPTVSGEIDRIRDSILDRQYEEEDRAWVRKQRAKTEAKDAMYSNMNTLLQEYRGNLSDALLEKDSEFMAKVNEIADEAIADGVVNPREEILSHVRALASIEVPVTSPSMEQEMRQAIVDFDEDRMTPKGLRDFALQNSDRLSKSDYMALLQRANVGGRSSVSTRNIPETLQAKWNASEAPYLQTFLTDTRYAQRELGSDKPVLTPEGRAMQGRINKEIITRIQEFILDGFDDKNPRANTEAIQQIVTDVYTAELDLDENGKPKGVVSLNTQPDQDIRQHYVGSLDHKAAGAVLNRQRAETALDQNTDVTKEPKLQRDLDKAVRAERSQQQAVQRRIRDVLNGPVPPRVDIHDWVTGLDGQTPDPVFPGSTEQLRSDLEFISKTHADGPLKLRLFYAKFRKMAREHDTYSLHEAIDPFKMQLFDSPDHYNKQEEEYKQWKEGGAVEQPRTVELQIPGFGAKSFTVSEPTNIFIMLEKDFGWDLSEGSPKKRALDLAVTQMFYPTIESNNGN